jgi:hypothetical protein
MAATTHRPPATLQQLLALHDPVRHAGHAQRYGNRTPVMLAQSYLGWMDAVAGDAAGARARADAALEHARAERARVQHLLCVVLRRVDRADCAGDVRTRGPSRSRSPAARQPPQTSSTGSPGPQAIEGWLAGLQAPERGIALIDDARERYPGHRLDAGIAVFRSPGLQDRACRGPARCAGARGTACCAMRWRAACASGSTFFIRPPRRRAMVWRAAPSFRVRMTGSTTGA